MKTALTRLNMKAILSLLVCLTTLPLLADYTYVWSGADPRFSGSFSISNEDSTNRSFVTLTALNFQFHDSQNPSLDLVLDDLIHLTASGGKATGFLTSDGLHLDHTKSCEPYFPNLSFFIQAYKYDQIDEGLISWIPTGDSQEHFEYVNYVNNNAVELQTTGTWSLETVPEPSVISLVCVSLCVFGVHKCRNQGRNREAGSAVNAGKPSRCTSCFQSSICP